MDTRSELREFLTTANRAVGLSRFGSPEVLGVVSVPVAAPGPLDALVRVRAAAVNPSDTLLRTGRQAERLGGISPPFIPGMDLSRGSGLATRERTCGRSAIATASSSPAIETSSRALRIPSLEENSRYTVGWGVSAAR